MNAVALLMKHSALAYAVAAEFYLPGAERQDVEQEALIGLWYAALEWKRDRGASFPTFARLVIRRRLVTVLRAALRRRHEPLNDAFSLTARADNVTAQADNDDIAIIDTLAGGRDPYEVVVLREAFERLAAAVASLSELERTALAVTVTDAGYTHDKQLDNAVFRARHKLRTAVGEALTG